LFVFSFLFVFLFSLFKYQIEKNRSCSSQPRDLIPGIDKRVKGGDEFVWGEHKVKVMDVAGHTKGQVAFHFPKNGKHIYIIMYMYVYFYG
jgi:glyoxylase-like metal-dependent hydrolase (beta-lactamase superfamily II)